MRSASLAIGLVLLVLPWPLRAQPPEDRQGEMRRPLGGRGYMPVDVVARRLAMVLELSETQRAQYDEIAAKYNSLATEQQLQRGEMLELGRQLREARQAGDQARVDEIRQQMGQRSEQRSKLIRDFFAEIEPILNEQQKAKLEETRQRFEERAAARRRAGDLFDLLRRLPEELDLTDEQRVQFDALVSEQRQQGQRLREQWRDLQPLFEELRSARAAGDQQRVAELEAELDAKRPSPPDPDGLFTRLEPILTDEQKAKLAELRSGVAGSGLDDVRAVLRAAQRLNLSDEQEQRLRTIIREAQAGQRQARDRDARAELAQRVKGQILEILDARQAAEFERFLARDARPGRRERGPAPGGPRF